MIDFQIRMTESDFSQFRDALEETVRLIGKEKTVVAKSMVAALKRDFEKLELALRARKGAAA